MKKQLFTFFIAAATTFVGCSDDDNDTNPVVTGKQLIKVTETSGGQSTVSDLTYNSKNQLTQIKQQNGNDVLKFTYDATGNITKMEANEDSENMVFEVTYNNGLPSSGKFTMDTDEGEVVLNQTYKVEGGKVTEIQQKVGEINYGKITITYTATGNVDKVKTETTIPNAPQSTSTVTYTYGTKKNMFPNAGFKFVLDPYLSPELFAKNEILSEKVEGGNTTTYTYTYDTNGYPLTKTSNDGTSFKYDYK